MKTLIQIADSWIGTKFKQSMGTKGIGTDCYHLVIELIRERSGIDPLGPIPVFYHGQEHNDIMKTIDSLYDCICIKELYTGTLLFFKIGKLWLAGMYIKNGLMITVNQNTGVCYLPVNRYKAHLVYQMYPKVLAKIVKRDSSLES